MEKKDLIKTLAKIVGREDILASPADLIAYSYDATAKRSLPDVVIFPNGTIEVSDIMKIASRERIPVIARGAGTNLTGGTITCQGGIVLELSRLNRILSIDTARHRAVVEPGVVNLDLQNALQPLGFMYAPDPASQKSCTLGGNAAEDAGGPRCLKYGVTSNHIREVELVLADGQIVHIGTANDENYGYDLLGPIVGSEGTLGIVTKLVLRIMRLPEAFQTMLVIFKTLDDAGQSVSDIIASGIVPGALELLDNPVVQAVEASFHAGYPMDAEALLLIELDGVKEGIEPQVQRITDICSANHVREIRLARTTAEREALWQGRRGAFGAVARVRTAYACQDATVPRNKLVPMLHEVSRIAKKYQLLIGNVAHAGDGNFHPLIMFDNRDPEETHRVEKAGKEILAAGVALEGTITGEHGVGLEKQDSMPLMFKAGELGLMRRVKKVFDPENILNPGKIFPSEKITAKTQDTEVAPASTTQREGKNLNEELMETLGQSNILTNPQELAAYQVDERLPSLAIFPSNNDQVCRIVETANRYLTPLIPWGNGSKQAKGLPLTETGIILSLKNMNRILELDAPNLTVKVGAGMDYAEFQRELAKHGLFFPLEPADIESATIGGSLATGSNGPRRLAYGTVRDLVLGITAVTPSGEVVHVGGKTMKNVAGYDLRKLFLSSWGNLGIITEAILRLFYLPEEHKTLLLKLPGIESTSQIVRQISASFLRPESIELVDASAAQNLSKTFYLKKEELLLLIGVAGSNKVVSRHITEIRTLSEANKAKTIAILSGSDEEAIWAEQRHCQLSLPLLGPEAVVGKAVVPLHRTGEMFQEIKQTALRHGFHAGVTGHAGNGVLYSAIFPEEHSAQSGNGKVLATIGELTRSANRLGGVFLIESGPLKIRQTCNPISQRSDYWLMKRLKEALDPKNILNPGKLVRT